MARINEGFNLFGVVVEKKRTPIALPYTLLLDYNVRGVDVIKCSDLFEREDWVSLLDTSF